MTRFLLDEQIASQPAAVRDVLERIEPPALDPGRPLVFAGIGTSLHACRVAAAWVTELSEGRLRPVALEAHELALHGPLRPEDQIVVVSHRGTKNFPSALLARASGAGASTVMVTGTRAAEVAADVVLRTCPDERSATHTVSYLTALAVLGRLVARMLGERGRALEAALEQVPAAVEAVLAATPPQALAERLRDRAPILVTGFGLDAVTAPEAALKLKEGAYLWAEGMSVEAARRELRAAGRGDHHPARAGRWRPHASAPGAAVGDRRPRDRLRRRSRRGARLPRGAMAGPPDGVDRAAAAPGRRARPPARHQPGHHPHRRGALGVRHAPGPAVIAPPAQLYPARSMIMAIPCPTPMHMLQSA